VFSQKKTMNSFLLLLSVAFLHAIVLGNVFTFGLFIPELSVKMGRDTTDVAFIGSMEYLLFLFSGLLVLLNRSSHDNAPAVIGVILWFIGYLTSIFVTNDYVIFTGVFVTFAGLGSGLVYWSTLAMVPTWFWSRKEELVVCGLTLRRVPLAMATLSLSPACYNLVFPYAVEAYGTGLLFNQSWSSTYIITVPICAIVMLIISLNTHRIVGEHNENREGDYRSKLSFSLLLIGIICFQSAFFVPYVYIVPYMETFNATVAETSLATSLIGGGSICGRIIFALLCSTFGMPGELMAFNSYCMSIILFIWLICKDVIGMTIFSFFFGFTSGACYVLFPVYFATKWVNVNWFNYGPASLLTFKLSLFSGSLFLGELCSSLVNLLAFPHNGNITSTMLFAGISSMIGSILFFVGLVIERQQMNIVSDDDTTSSLVVNDNNNGEDDKMKQRIII